MLSSNLPKLNSMPINCSVVYGFSESAGKKGHRGNDMSWDLGPLGKIIMLDSGDADVWCRKFLLWRLLHSLVWYSHFDDTTDLVGTADLSIYQYGFPWQFREDYSKQGEIPMSGLGIASYKYLHWILLPSKAHLRRDIWDKRQRPYFPI